VLLLPPPPPPQPLPHAASRNVVIHNALFSAVRRLRVGFMADRGRSRRSLGARRHSVAKK
jgi:hypothetical protein